MNSIAVYADISTVKTIQTNDAEAWRKAIKAFIHTAQSMVQNLIEYKAYGCSANDLHISNKMIEKITDDLNTSRARLNALESGFPTFR